VKLCPRGDQLVECEWFSGCLFAFAEHLKEFLRRGWAMLHLSRGALIGIAHATNAHVAAGTQSELLIVGVNRLGQAASIATRALIAGIALTPEKGGSHPFAGLFPTTRSPGVTTPITTVLGYRVPTDQAGQTSPATSPTSPQKQPTAGGRAGDPDGGTATTGNDETARDEH